MNVILNKSKSRISQELSCFSKSFFDELYDKFKLDKEFWDNELLNLYLQNYDIFEQNIKTKYNIILNKNDVPTILIKNWRYNRKLIDYIIKQKKQDYYLNKDINGEHDKLYIAHVDYDDYENHEIEYEYNGEEFLYGKINYKEIIEDLQHMILKKYNCSDDIEFYFRLNNTNKYTYKCFEKYIDNFDYWEKHSGEYEKEVLELDLEEDTY